MERFTHDNAPNPSRFIESYRFLGYDNYSAIADILDNSFDAFADNIWLHFDTEKKGAQEAIYRIRIADDGQGMDKDTLEQAFRLGSLVQRNERKDLGKFGVGSASASLSIARRTTVITKSEKGQYLTKIIDLDHMIKSNTFNGYLGEATKEEVALFKETIPGSEAGTLVILECCDNLSDHTHKVVKSKARKHLGQVFRMFISAGKRIHIDGESIRLIDPLVTDGFEYKGTKYKSEIFSETDYELKVYREGKETIEKIRIKLAALPNLGTKKEVKDGWPADIEPPSQKYQGFYILRNNREIAEGITLSGLFERHPSKNRFRGEIHFSGAVDKDMGVNFTKRRIDPIQSVQDQLRGWLKEQLDTLEKILVREDEKENEEVKESFRVSEAIIDSKKLLLIRKKETVEELSKELEEQRKRRAKEAGKQKDEEVKDESGKVKEFHFDTVALGTNGVFFEVGRRGQTIVISYNLDHSFYKDFYVRLKKEDQNCINLLMHAYVMAKRSLGTENASLFEQVEGVWSLNLKALL